MTCEPQHAHNASNLLPVVCVALAVLGEYWYTEYLMKRLHAHRRLTLWLGVCGGYVLVEVIRSIPEAIPSEKIPEMAASLLQLH